jgi:3-dehydroquinate dehydratase-1
MDDLEYEVVGVTRDLTSIKGLDAKPDLVEFQINRADRPMEQLQNYDGSIPLIISWNSTEAAMPESSIDEKAILEVFKYNLVEYVDLHVDLIEEHNSLKKEIDSMDVELIVSYYYPDGTPPEDEILSQIERSDDSDEVIKIIPYAGDRADALNFLQVLSTASQSGHTVTGYCRGPSGKYTRIISVLHGSKFCYGTVKQEAGENDTSDISLDYLLEILDTVISGADDVELMDALKGKFS